MLIESVTSACYTINKKDVKVRPSKAVQCNAEYSKRFLIDGKKTG
jgi:hypothetical protein